MLVDTAPCTVESMKDKLLVVRSANAPPSTMPRELTTEQLVTEELMTVALLESR